MKDHLDKAINELESKLRVRGSQALLSRELAVIVIASAANLPQVISPAGAVVSGIIGLGALLKLAVDYDADRRKILAKNPLGYLYKSKRFPKY
jgi:hypothetical protein